MTNSHGRRRAPISATIVVYFYQLRHKSECPHSTYWRGFSSFYSLKKQKRKKEVGSVQAKKHFSLLCQILSCWDLHILSVMTKALFSKEVCTVCSRILEETLPSSVKCFSTQEETCGRGHVFTHDMDYRYNLNTLLFSQHHPVHSISRSMCVLHQ